MRVLHIISGLGDGGAEGVLFRLCSESVGVEHYVISLTDDGKYGPLMRAEGLQVWSLGMQKWTVRVRGLLKLIWLILSLRPDVVQTWMPHADLIGGAAAKLCGVKKIFWNIRAANYGIDYPARRPRALVRTLAMASHFLPNKIVSCAEAARTSHIDFGYREDKIVVIPNGYDLRPPANNNAARQHLREKFGLPPDTKLIGMVARYHPQKDHSSLLNALRILLESRKDFVCFLVGRGIDSANHQLDQAIKFAGVSQHVILLGQLEQAQDFMADLDLHVLSSAVGEGFPNVIAESMLLGVPNVSTDVGGAKEVIGEAGWVVEPRNPAELARAMSLGLGLTPIEKTDLSRVCSRRIKDNFSLQKMVSSYILLYSTRTLLLITRHENLGASSRLRSGQYLSPLVDAGFEVTRSSFFSDEYLRRRYSSQALLVEVLRSYFRRLSLLWRARKSEILWIEKEIFPFLPWFLEKLFIPKRAKVVADFDDAVYLTYETHKSIVFRKFLGSKIRNIMARSDLCLAGNDVIAKYAEQSGAKSIKTFPTVIDIKRYKNALRLHPSKPAGSKNVVGWIGSPVTWRSFVTDKVPVLRQVARQSDVEIWAIGADENSAVGDEDWIHLLPWTEETELALLAKIDIGIMPLDDTPWARGKCGYKILQYMAMATPVVASPVGVNRQIITHGENGFLASSDAEWAEYLGRLIDNPALRKSMGALGLSRVEERYSLPEQARKLVGYLEEL